MKCEMPGWIKHKKVSFCAEEGIWEDFLEKVTLVHLEADKGVISYEDLDWEHMTMALWLYWNWFSLLSFHSFITQAE